MTRCNECNRLYPYKSHYGICVNTFGKCVDCMIKDKKFDEGHLEQITFLAGDNEPTNATIN